VSVESAVSSILAGYRPPDCYDELVGFGPDPLPHCAPLHEALRRLPADEWQRRAALADRVFHDVGVTFTLTADEAGVERTIPFDPVPRVVAAAEWEHLTRGLFQRIRALNAFLWDVYHDQRCLRDGVVPRWVVYTGRHLQRPMMGIDLLSACTPTWAASTWSGTARARSACWRTTSASPPG